MSDGVDVELLDAVRLVLLHSEVRSEGHGHSYLVGLNGTEMGTGDQLGEVCSLAVPNLVGLSCLTATGGAAGPLTSATANVATVNPALAAVSALNPVAAFAASTSAGAGQAVADATPAAAPVTTVAGETSRVSEAAAAPVGSAATARANLPRTGAAVGGLLGSALTALVLGRGLRRFGRRSLRA